MGKINKLPKNIWELIAAGEVVERPASVVKELLENSIDAGASMITVEIQHGGIRYIRVTDNGSGIAREDVPLAFISHATSEVSAAEDLDAISTLGFRGEALASVCAVSRVEMLTKTRDEQIGTRIEIEGSQQTAFDDAGCPDGTTIVIRDLFYNTPARMKFLKSDKSESMAVAGIVDKIAISHPEISIRFIRDGRQTVCTNGNGSLKDAVTAVYGKEFSETLIDVEYSLNGMKIKGFVSKPFCSRGSSAMQLFFVNNRYIKSKTAGAALNEAYKHSIMVGRFPACVLFAEVRPELVDVNVHPAKTEVRFSNERAIFDLVYYAAKNAIEHDSSRPQMSVKAAKTDLGENILASPLPDTKQSSFRDLGQQTAREVINTDGSVKTEQVSFVNEDDFYPLMSTTESRYNSSEDEETDFLLNNPSPEDETENNIDEKPSIEASADEPSFRYIGEAFKTYIIIEYNSKLCLIDKHAAHERMIYNSLKKDNGSNGSQLLLKPVNVALSKEEYLAVTENLEMLSQAGFDIEDFGDGSVVVRACPLNLESEDITGLVTELANYLLNNKKDIIPEKLDWVYHSVACRAAVKSGNRQTDYELMEFAKQLLSDDTVRYCPHGRPVLIELSRYELDKQFGRIQ